MKILFAIKFLDAAGGGAERVLSQVASTLAAAGHDVTVLSYDAADAGDFYPLDARIHRVRLGLGKARSARFGETVQRIRALRRAVVTSAPDVAVGFMHSIYIPLGLALLGTGIPVVASEHMTWDQYRTVPFQAALLRGVAPLFRASTATSETVRSGFPRTIRGRMAVVPNPVAFPDRSSAPRPRSKRHTLLSVGRMRQEKDYPTLVQAFSHMAEAFPDWDLKIVGDGDGRGELERQVQALHLGERVKLPGSAANVGAEYEAADLYVNSSFFESFGLSTAEALAHGLPAVGFADCPGTNALIQDGVNGVLAAGGPRPAALAAALSQLMGCEERRSRLAAAAAGSVAGYALERIASQWEDLLSSVERRG